MGKYKAVAFNDLENYLANEASATEDNYIEVTGLKKEDLKGNKGVSASRLGEILRAKPNKKIALKLPAVSGLTDMTACFWECNNLVYLAEVPKGVENLYSCFEGTGLTEAPLMHDEVTNMRSCFYKCGALKKVAYIPKNVRNMWACFAQCFELTEIPPIPSSVENLRFCFHSCYNLTSVKLECAYDETSSDSNFDEAFNKCISLKAGSIEVPKKAQWEKYTAKANVMKTEAINFTYKGLYKKIEFGENGAALDTYLNDTASATDINYIEVTGLKKEDLLGGTEPLSASNLGKILNKNDTKKVVLKLPETVEGLNDMMYCFYNCKTLIGLTAIPKGVIQLWGCFSECTNLVGAPIIPESVTDIARCFSDCTELKTATLRGPCPADFDHYKNAFHNCSALTAGSIWVPKEHIQGYVDTANTGNLGVTSEKFIRY